MDVCIIQLLEEINLFGKKLALIVTRAENCVRHKACIRNVSNSVNKKGIFLKSAFEIENDLPSLFDKRMKKQH